MRSRSHRLQVSEPRHDDWVDGSWTVDCVCGVNFDDGEEMVDCDECGVWVHTRCARYVKSDKSFACDKCKSKNSGGGSSSGVRNDSEETEVAEFLVELPTKTLRMDNPNPANLSARRPFRLWTDIPMEERVHVQGVPGGESGLFSGVKMSSVFGPELWKCAGYVPKKFNFKYNEFECLDPGRDEEKIDEKDKTNDQENAKQADSRAGVLFSLLTVSENALSSPLVNSVGFSKSPIEGGGSHEVESPPQQKPDTQNVVSECPGDVIKENSSVRIVLHTGKRKKEEQQKVKDQYVKKKVRTTEKEGDRRATHGSRAVVASTFSSDAKHLKLSRDRGSKAASDDIKCGKNILRDQMSANLGECATNLASNEHSVEATPRNDASSDEISRQGNIGNGVPVGSEIFSKTNNGLESLVDINGSHSQSMPIKEEVPGEILPRFGDASDNGRVGIDSCDKEPVAAEVKIADPEAKESEDDRGSDVGEANSYPNKKLKSEKNAGDHELQQSQSLASNDVKSNTIKVTTKYADSLVNKAYPDEGKVVEASFMNAEVSDRKATGGSRSHISGSLRTEKSQLNDPYQSKREPSGSEGSMGARKKSSGFKHASEVTDELHKSNGTARSYSTASYQRKAVVSVVKSTSNSGAKVPKSSENHSIPTSPVPPVHIRQKESSQNSMGTMKDNNSADAVEHDGKSSRPRKLVKESSRLNSLSKLSESTKFAQMSDSRKLSSDLKDSSIHFSSKVPLPTNGASSHISGESSSPPPQGDGASNVQNKAAASAGPGKGEKLHQSGHTSSRGNVTSVTTPASSHVPATLSDEELALLLHHELNSSPRVPRVPRMRHAGSLPQLSSSTATSMLMKLTCSGGTKDNSMGPRRRAKDGEGSHGSVDVDNDARKMDRKPSLPDSRRQDSGCSVDPLSRRESMQPTKKLSSTLSSSGDANEHNVSSIRASSRNASDDDLHAVGRHTSRTLPGLIAEIMSEGKRMTYEELCNAVLPHWPHLRKHNGERYAYSSHSQAVLDCLRNRSEWARLVDRGPKTNAIRKRRKLDSDSVSIESLDDEENRGKNVKDGGSKSFESHQEDFPKGKRKARKRRRLALQGRRFIRRRRRAEVVSDDESESFSDSSEESESSEEEIQGGGGTSMAGSEASTSSDE